MARKNGERVLQAGDLLLKVAKILLIAGGVGLVLWLLMALAALVADPGHFGAYLCLQGQIGLINFLLIGGYALLGLGVAGWLVYVPGMFFVGLGQLVLNTDCDPMFVPPKEEAEEPTEETPEEEPAQEVVAEEVPGEAPVQAEPPVEEPTREPVPEEEEEPDWKALLERDDALIPGMNTPEELVAQLPPPGKSGRLVSPALMNILRYSLGQEGDDQLVRNLKHGLTRLTKPHEKELLGYILHIPDGDVRGAATALYKALSQKK